MQARHQLKQYEGRIKNIEEEHKQVLMKNSRRILLRKHLNQMTAVLSRKNVVISRFPLSLNKIHAFIYKCVLWAHIDKKVLPSNDNLINNLYETMCCQALGKMGSPKPDVGLRSQLETLQKQVQPHFFSMF